MPGVGRAQLYRLHFPFPETRRDPKPVVLPGHFFEVHTAQRRSSADAPYGVRQPCIGQFVGPKARAPGSLFHRIARRGTVCSEASHHLSDPRPARPRLREKRLPVAADTHRPIRQIQPSGFGGPGREDVVRPLPELLLDRAGAILTVCLNPAPLEPVDVVQALLLFSHRVSVWARVRQGSPEGVTQAPTESGSRSPSIHR